MRLRPANYNKTFIEEQIACFKTRNIQELRKIVPHWVFGNCAGKIHDRRLRAGNDRYIICLTNIDDLVSRADFGEVNLALLFTGEPLNDGRVARILHRWERQEFVDPPTIYIKGDLDHGLAFSDGRHRTKVAYLLGCHQMPFAVEKSDIGRVAEIINLSTI
jgi:hypothetical protein